MTRVRHQLPIPDGIYSGEPDDRILCGWADCENPGSGLHTIVECFAAPGLRDHPELPRSPRCSECRRMGFCSAGHMDFYVRSHRPGAWGKHSAGVNGRYL